MLMADTRLLVDTALATGHPDVWLPSHPYRLHARSAARPM